MKKRGIIRRTIKIVADVPRLMDSEFLQYSWMSIRKAAGILCTPRQATIQETFEESMVRLNLTEEMIEARICQFSRLSFIFIIMSLFGFAYTIYYAALGEITNVILGTVATLIILFRSFYFHFWMFQMKNRKLGCTIREWYNSNITGS